MQSITQALAWESWQRGKWTLLFMLLFANLMPLLWFTPIGTAAKFYQNDPTFVILQFLTVVINGFCFGIGVFVAIGDPSRLYLMPINHRNIAWLHLLPAMGLVALEIALMSWTINYCLELDWPIANYVFFAAAAWSVFHATFWYCGKQTWGVVCLTAVLVAMILWLKARHGPLGSTPTHSWEVMTPVEVLTLMAWILGALWLAGKGVERERRGESLNLDFIKARLVRWTDALEEKLLVNERRFASGFEAQRWYEWRKGGWAMPLVALVISVVAVTIFMVSRKNESSATIGLLTVSIVFLCFGGYGAGIAMGVSQTKWPKRAAQGSLEELFLESRPAVIGAFLGTRPVDDHTVARGIYRTMIKSFVVAWLIWNTLVLCETAVMKSLGYDQELGVPRDTFVLVYLLTFIIPWIAMVIGATTMLSGRQSIVIGTPFALIGASILSLMLLSSWVPAPQREFLRDAIVAGCALLVTVGVMVTFGVVQRRGLVPQKPLWITLGLAVGMLVIGIWVRPAQITQWHPYLPLLLGATALSVSPIATLTLAVSANRHR